MELSQRDLARYARQMTLPGFGRAAQEKLRSSTAMITRCGGLGGPIALYLAAAGIGKLILAHGGQTTWSNLNRQILQTADSVGRPRMDAIVQSIQRFNPDVQIEPVPAFVDTLAVARPLVAKADVVCDATPSFQERYALNEAAVLEGKPMVEAAMNAMESHLTVLVPGRTPCLRCLYPEPPPSWQVYGFPVLGAVSGSLGCLAAIEAIKILTGFGRSLVGRMLVYDAEVNMYQQVELTRNPTCPVCGSGSDCDVPTAPDFYDPWVDLYDLMVDWDKRLAREGPALASLLAAAGAKRVLDVACGTGRHLAWLANAGLDVAGADLSAGMLARARRQLPPGREAPLFRWSMAAEPSAQLRAAGPFDAILCLGNSFPHLVSDAEVAAALANFRSLLAPGGLAVLGLKALASLRQAKREFLPLVKRRVEGADLLFVRFYDFAVADPEAADFHLLIVGPQVAALKGSGGIHHAVTRLRAWEPQSLVEHAAAAGFEQVRAVRNLAGARVAPGDNEDVFVLARKPR